jgi:hypothetical protein
MNITRGIQNKPIKAVIYGPEGIGKTTFAAQFPDPLFVDVEGSTTRMDVARTDTPTSLAMLLGILTEIRDHNPGCKTVVIDTADWAERLCIKTVCDKYKKTGIEEFGYGKGYTYVYEEFGGILNLLNDIADRGVNVVLTAHAAIRKFEQPDEMGSYDRWELKMINSPKCNVCAMIKEWADLVLFANYKTTVISTDKEGKKNKARGGQRVMYTTHDPCWDAKNRFGLAQELPFDFAQIAHIFGQTVPVSNMQQPTTSANSAPVQQTTPPEPPKPAPVSDTSLDIGCLDEFQPIESVGITDGIPPALADLMRQNNVSEDEIRLAVSMRGYFPDDMPITAYPPDFVQGVLIGAWAQVFGMIQDNRKLPFS